MAGLFDNDVARELATLLGCDARFNTYCFLILFLPATLLAYWAVPRREWKFAVVTLASLIFYSFWDVRFVVLVLGSAAVDFLVALRIGRENDPARRKAFLWISILFNLGVLGFFKYALFFAENAVSLAQLFGAKVSTPGFNIVLPVGISFYTFQTLSYTIDVYRGDVLPTKRFVKYVAYVSMFPQLVAGPIVRYRTLDRQMDALPGRPRMTDLVLGVALFAMGLFKKVVVADSVAVHSDGLWGNLAGLDTVTAWLAALGYTVQLYFDFSGYSDMAIGLGLLLGLRFPINFRAPYQAINISDFWRRWHISLSTFLRDYLYIPLGGNRGGRRRAQINMLIVMLLGGLWHGAAWTFVVWGLYHGLLLALYRQVQPGWDRMPVVFQRAATFFLVVVGWVIFRAESLADAGTVLGLMLWPAGGDVALLIAPTAISLFAIIAFTQWAKPTSDLTVRPTPWWALGIAIMLMWSFVRLSSGNSPFLYYQF